MSYVVFQHHTSTWYFSDGKYKSKWSRDINNAKIFDTFTPAAKIADYFPCAKILEVEVTKPTPKEQPKMIGYHI